MNIDALDLCKVLESFARFCPGLPVRERLRSRCKTFFFIGFRVRVRVSVCELLDLCVLQVCLIGLWIGEIGDLLVCEYVD